MRAWSKNGDTLPANVTLYVDRYTCENCQIYLTKLMQALGVKKLTIITKSGDTISLTAP